MYTWIDEATMGWSRRKRDIAGIGIAIATLLTVIMSVAFAG